MSRVPAVIAAAAVVVSVSAMATPALAHERRQVGPYQLVVGFLTEPAFAGTVNGVDLRVTDTRVTPAKNVEGLQDTVTVDVFHAGLTTPLSLKVRARFGQPGAYAADFIPTRPGSYRFAFRGKIEQQDLNETFESGPGRFDEAKEATALQYPDKVPVAADLSDRLDSIERQLATIQALAIAALALAIVLPLGAMWRARQRR
jgi:hypothetical protein